MPGFGNLATLLWRPKARACKRLSKTITQPKVNCRLERTLLTMMSQLHRVAARAIVTHNCGDGNLRCTQTRAIAERACAANAPTQLHVAARTTLQSKLRTAATCWSRSQKCSCSRSRLLAPGRVQASITQGGLIPAAGFLTYSTWVSLLFVVSFSWPVVFAPLLFYFLPCAVFLSPRSHSYHSVCLPQFAPFWKIRSFTFAVRRLALMCTCEHIIFLISDNHCQFPKTAFQLEPHCIDPSSNVAWCVEVQHVKSNKRSMRSHVAWQVLI